MYLYLQKDCLGMNLLNLYEFQNLNHHKYFGLFENIKENDWGGHKLLRKHTDDISRHQDNKLDIKRESQSSQNNLDLQGNIVDLPQVNLEIGKGEDSLSVDILKRGGEDVSSTVKNVIQEIDTSDKVKELEEEVSQKYEVTVHNHLRGNEAKKKADLDNFRKIKQQVEDSFTKKTKSVPLPSLSREDRFLLQKIYELYSNLREHREQLTDDLNDIRKIIEESGKPSFEPKQTPSPAEIKKALNQIKLTGGKIEVTKNDVSKTRVLTND